LQQGCTLLISSAGNKMLATVDFDDQLSLQAGKVDDVGTRGHLASEMVAANLLTAESHPETDFSIGHPGAKPTRFLNTPP
jgi:hypothetical protein